MITLINISCRILIFHHSRLCVISSLRPREFVTTRKRVIVVGIIFILGLTELVLVRLSSPENMIFFRACTRPEESGRLKPGQIFAKGYSLMNVTYAAVQSGRYIYHTIALVTTIATAIWLRKQERVLASGCVEVRST